MKHEGRWIYAVVHDRLQTYCHIPKGAPFLNAHPQLDLELEAGGVRVGDPANSKFTLLCKTQHRCGIALLWKWLYWESGGSQELKRNTS